MKAVFYTGYGGPEKLEYGDLPQPLTGDKKILVEVKAASVNPVDYKVMAGAASILSGSKFPKVPGSDFAGIVKETGRKVTGFKPGDKIYGSSPVIFGKSGVLAEYVAIDVRYARLMPDKMSFVEAASLPVAALTALNGLRKAGISPGKRVLINGATGGVGHFAVQIAKAQGAHVTATCSTSNVSFARLLGADEVTGYSREELQKTGRKYHSILDAYGKMHFEDVCRLLEKRGVYTSTLFFPPSSFAALPVRIIFNKILTSANMRSKPEDFEYIEQLYLGNKLKPFIDKTYTLSDVAAAFEYAEKGKPRGKVVIQTG